MCGIIAILLANEDEFVNQMIFDGLTVLQHRGQDAAGIVTSERRRLHLRKDNGLVKDVFQTHHMAELRGNVGLGHCRYPTAGSSSCAEAQPLYTNYPHGICVAHNGNLTNTHELTDVVRDTMQRHVNTDSDSEVLLNIFAECMMNRTGRGAAGHGCEAEDVFAAIEGVMEKCKGGYAGAYLINGVGIVGFRDPHGIRPVVLGSRQSSLGNGKLDYVLASESVAIDTLGFNLERDVRAGEAVFIDMRTGEMQSKICHPDASTSPCIFEYVYFARPDSIMDGVSVYESRLKMGEKLAEKVLKLHPDHDIDVVIPIPDTSRTSALQAAYCLGRPFREGFIKNRYIARTFIMPGQETRKKSVRLKLNTIKSEFAGRNVLLVDDSVVRGTTAREIVEMARDAGANKVYFTSAAPPIRYPNIYGIDIPTMRELVAYERDEEQIAKHIGCDWIIYQDLKDLEASVSTTAPPDQPLEKFDTSCFSAKYVTGETIGDEYFTRLHKLRNDAAQEERRGAPLKDSQSRSSMTGTMHSAPQSMDGCEPVSNDKRQNVTGAGSSCEPLNNN